jgi:hypothetical protein
MVATAGLPDAYGIRILRAQLVERRERLLREIRTRLESSRGSPASEPGDDAPTRSEMHDLDLAESQRRWGACRKELTACARNVACRSDMRG